MKNWVGNINWPTWRVSKVDVSRVCPLSEWTTEGLTSYTLTSACLFSIMFPINFLWYQQGEFAEKSASAF